MKILFLTIFTFASFIFSSCFAQQRPAAEIEVAQRYLAAQLGQNLATILQGFDVEWEYLIVCEDDQPLMVKFTNSTQYCQVTLGSESLTVFSSYCHASN